MQRTAPHGPPPPRALARRAPRRQESRRGSMCRRAHCATANCKHRRWRRCTRSAEGPGGSAELSGRRAKRAHNTQKGKSIFYAHVGLISSKSKLYVSNRPSLRERKRNGGDGGERGEQVARAEGGWGGGAPSCALKERGGCWHTHCGVEGNCAHENGGSGPSYSAPVVGPLTANAVLLAHREAMLAFPSKQPCSKGKWGRSAWGGG
jgi:hypothetical protein